MAGSRRWKHLVPAEKKLAEAIGRAFIDFQEHPQSSELRPMTRNRKLRELEAHIAADAQDMVQRGLTAEGASNDDEEEIPVLRPDLAQLPFSTVDSREKQRLLDYFDLEHEQALVDVDQEKVVYIVLDQLGEMLRATPWLWWEKCGASVRGAVMEGRLQREHGQAHAGRNLTKNERVWKSMLEFQKGNAWDTCVKAARLAGCLLLFHMEAKDMYRSVRSQFDTSEAWEFPERFFGGMYGEEQSSKQAVGKWLKRLYRSHRDVTKAAVRLACECRDLLLEYGRYQAGPLIDSSGDEGGAASSLSRANSLVVRTLFPWMSPDQLGNEENIHEYDSFQRHLATYVAVYGHFWCDVGVYQDATGVSQWVPPRLRTWDFVNSELYQFETLTALKRNVENRN